MSTPYDAFPYRALPIVEAHVDRLALMAHLCGCTPTAPSHARVLELGCADGGHLVPMAVDLPSASFVGIDRSARQIDDGKRFVEPLGLDNLVLHHGDALHLPDDLGSFDYVICHGVYSWIAPEDRHRLLQSIREVLSPGGVAYVSYNTWPGWTTRRTIRDFILENADLTGDADTRVAAARAMLRFLHDAADPEQAHGQLLRETCTSLLGTSPQYLIHGLLAPDNGPCTLRAFAEAAGDAGLAYLGDAVLARMTGADLHDGGQAALANVPGGQVDREQILDVLEHRSFRQSLLVLSDVPLQRSVPWQRVRTLWLSSRARGVEGHPTDDQPARFETDGGTVRTADPVWKTGLAVLGAVWPAQLPFDSWVAGVAAALGRTVEDLEPELGRQVLPAHAKRVIDLAPRDRGVAARVTGHPRASPWARRQLALGHPVTDGLHGPRRLPRPLAALLAHCDGKTDHEGLLAALAGHDDLAQTGPLAEWLPGALEALRIRALLRSPSAP